MRVYTLGYEGLSLDAYTSILCAFNVGVVLDVRERAWSQRPDYIKSKMDHGLASVGINYIHVQSAGNPSSIRKTVTTPEECLMLFRKHLRLNPDCVGELYSYVRLAAESGRPACLTCYERASENCHRSVLIEALLELDPTLDPIHLPPAYPITLRRGMSEFASVRSLHKSAFLKPSLFRIK
jgi:uncharacterized protein (DUF488 family)